jgi:ECF sigma factor
LFEDQVAARVVELRQFAGLGHEEIAVTLDFSVDLARQKWTFARVWLRYALKSLVGYFGDFSTVSVANDAWIR